MLDLLAIEERGFRQADVHEVWAATGDTCFEQCWKALHMEDATTLTIFADDKPCGMFGSTPLVGMGIQPGWCVLWLLATDDLLEIKADFLKQCRAWTNFIQRHYPYGLNYVHADNAAALRWCEWVGFKLDPPAPYGNIGEKFRRAIRIVDQ